MANNGQSDVLIIGAGPAGCAAGIVLARAGLDVCVADRAVFPRDKTCGDAVSNDGVELLSQLGALSSVEAVPHALVRHAAAEFPDGSRVARDYDKPGYIVPRLHLDNALRLSLEHAGATLMQGVKVNALLRHGHRVVGATANELHWNAKVVIACDGYGSIGLDALGVEAPRDEHLAVSVTGYFHDVTHDAANDTADHYFTESLPYGYGWIFPAVEGLSNVGVYLRADAYKRTGVRLRAMLESFIASHPDRLGRARLEGKLRAWSLPIAPRKMPLHMPGLLLAGDAAGLVDPLSGEGIWQALRSGMLAGETSARACRANGLDDVLGCEYQRACEREIIGPSRAKARVQQGMDFLVNKQLYRSRLVQAMLRFGYQHHALEMTKS
jgi:menaquinone-9 beta-reductase